MKFFRNYLSLISAIVLAIFSHADAADLRSIPETLLFTAGTTHHDAAGRDHAYLLWQAPASDLMSGKAYAIYSKAGDAESPALFTLESVVQSSLDDKLASVQLARAVSMGQNLEELDELLSNIWRSLHLPPPNIIAELHENGEPLPEPPALPADRSLRTVKVLQTLFTDPTQLGTARTLAASQPALALVLGCAWAGPMPADTRTYELREYNSQTCVDGAVIGRVTLTGGAPVLLPPPGGPLQVPDLTETGDLRINLRWATPDALRRRLFLHQGYDLWRMPWSTATANGFVGTPPTLAQLENLATRVSGGVVYAAKLFDVATVMDFTADSETRHFTDDNNRFANPAAPTPFADGAEFGYVVVARDLLGRPGLPSAAGYGRACRTIGPRPPLALDAKVTYGEAAPDGTKPQSFTLTWEQNPDIAPGLASATSYDIFRTDERFVFPVGHPQVGQLDLTKIIANVLHTGGPAALTFTDPDIAANPAAFLGKTTQYAVRAVFQGACLTLSSPLSPPALISLEDNSPAPEPQPAGPPPGDCTIIAIMATAELPAGESAAQAGYHFRIRLTRRDSGIASARFTRTTNSVTTDLGEVHFGDDEDNAVFIDLNLTQEEAQNFSNTFTVQAIGFDGTASRNIGVIRGPTSELLATNIITPFDFSAGVLSTGTLSESDPLAAFYINTAAGTLSFSDVQMEKRTRQMQAVPNGDPGQRCLVSRRKNDGSWVEIGIGIQYGPAVFFEDPTIDLPEAGEPDLPAPIATDYRARRLINLPTCDGGTHLTQSGDGRPSPVSLTMLADPNAREYRFYRRVDDGELEFIAQGGTRPLGLALIRRQDPGVPPGAEVITYYGQFMGKNGIASTLRVLGVVRPHYVPPTPVLTAPRPLGDPAAPTVRLTWSCPPEQVEQFELFLDTGKASAKYSIAHPAALVHLTPVNYERPPTVAPTVWRIRRVGSVAKTIVRREGLLTARVGSAVPGAGPQFSIDLPVTPNTRYSISVRAVGRRGAGTASRTYDFTWRPPPPALVDKPLPWPFRDLPGVVVEANANASGLRAENLPLKNAFEPHLEWPSADTGSHVGFRIGEINPRGTGSFRFIQRFNAAAQLSGLTLYPISNLPGRDFNIYVSQAPGTLRAVLPVVMYRQQLPSEDWPVVSGDVIQVSPLVSRITWENSSPSFTSLLQDPYIAVTSFTIQDRLAAALYLLDTTPRIVGARYRYWLVCFGADTGAPELVIPSTLEPRAN